MTTHAAMYVNAIIDDAGNALANVSFTVTDPNTNQPVTLYSNSNKTPLVGTPRTDADGNATVFCDASQGPVVVTVPLTGKSLLVPPVPDGRDILTGQTGGTEVGTDPWLIAIAASQAFKTINNVTRDSNDTLLSASVTWPDNTPGSFTTDSVSSNFPGAVDSYHVTYEGATTKTVSQQVVLRDAHGDVSNAQLTVT